MLLNSGTIECVAEFFSEKKRPPLVVDPVMISTSGTELLRPGAFRVLKKRLLPRATVVTPNVPEAELLTGLNIREPEDMRAAAQKLLNQFGCAVVVTGGHLTGREVVEVFYDGREELLLTAPRVKGGPWHGTGCRFTAVIAAELAKGKKLAQAIVEAKEYVAGWID
jgi:hydroxymethylpyrimidine/phosphomethylpyrimidine kinase